MTVSRIAERVASSFIRDIKYKMPKTVGKWKINEGRRRNDESIIEYVALGGWTILIDLEHKNWGLTRDNKTIDAFKVSGELSPARISRMLRATQSMYDI